MQCKFCKAEMEADRKYCPTCGKRQDAPVKKPKQQQKKKAPKTPMWQIVLAIVLSVAIVGLLIYLFVSNDGAFGKKPNTTATEPLQQSKEKIDFAAHANVIVGKLMGEELSNGLLQVFYSDILVDFVSEYSGSLSYIGVDVNESLADQAYPFDGAETWEDYFLDLALERWENCVMMCKLAEQDGFVLSEEKTKLVEDQMASLEDIAKESNYADGTTMLKTFYGEACTKEIYKEYLVLQTTANAYYDFILEVSDEQIDAAYEKNKDAFAEKGITLDSALASSVRHILIMPEGGTLSADGKTMTYTDEAWAACLAKAEEVYNEWKNGEATEDSFVAMVSKYTKDEVSISVGGLYEGITRESNYVAAFEDWATNIARQTGDTELVRTEYGYHFMYYVSGEPEWKYHSRVKAQEEDLDAQNKRIEALLQENPPEILRDQIVVQNVYQLYY